jgi:hypothetical protein
VPNPANSIGIQPPTHTVIWGKRQEDEVTLAPPQATVIWGRDAEAAAEAQNSIGLGAPYYSVWMPKASTAGGVVWGRDAAAEATPAPGVVEREE